MKSKKKRKKRKKERRKETTRKNLGPLHSHEIRRGRVRSFKADKKFASGAKRKRKKEKERKNAPTGVNRLYHARLK